MKARKVLSLMLAVVLMLSFCVTSAGALASADVIEVAAGKGGAEAGANTWDFDRDTIWTESNNWPINRVTDGDETTSWAVHGGGNHAMGAINLGQKYKITKVEVLAYSAVDPGRGANFEIALSNVLPTSAATEETYTNSKLTLGIMPYRDDRTSVATGYDTFTVDYTVAGADAEGYQYVCLEEMTDGVTYVAEVKVYVETVEEPAPPETTPEPPTEEEGYVNVALGKGSEEVGVGVWNLTNQNVSSEHSNTTTSRMTNGIAGDNTLCFSLHSGDTGMHQMAYIDLGAQYDLKQVKVLAWSPYDSNRGANIDVYLSNVVPTDAATQATYNSNKVLLGTTTAEKDRTSADCGYDVFDVSDGAAGGYRYVCFEDVIDGIMYIDEVQALVDAETQPLSFSGVSFAVEDDVLTMDGQVSNGTENDTAVLLVSAYDATGSFMQAVAKEMELPTAVLEQAYSDSINVSELSGYANLDVTVVNNLADMVPALYVQNALAGNRVIEETATEASGFVMSAEQNMDGVSVNGTSPVSLCIKIMATDVNFI